MQQYVDEQHFVAYNNSNNMLTGGNEMQLSSTTVIAVKRLRGELNISVVELSKQTGISRWTLDKLFNGKTNNVRPTTYEKLNNWLAKQI